MKVSKNVLKIILTLVISAVMILSVFVANIYLRSENDEKNNDSELFVEIFTEKKEGVIPFNVSFTSLVVNNQGSVDYLWDFGDESTSNSKNPKHEYKENGTFLCNLKVTDSSGETKNDSVKIIATENHKPTVSFSISEKNYIRKYIPILPKLADPMGGKTLYRLISNNIIPSSLLNKKGEINCESVVSDKDGDEIVSYKWELTAPTVTTAFGTIQPKYEFEGKNITFPLLLTYGTGNYDVTLTVTDSAGQTTSVDGDFKVGESSVESTTNYIFKVIIMDKILNTLYQDWLDEEQKHMISDPLWNYLFGPIENVTTQILYKYILPLIPEEIEIFGRKIEARNWTINLYYSIWGSLENKFPRPIEPKKKAELTFKEPEEFNFTAFVDENGNITTDTTIQKTFSIINNDSTETAKDIYLTLKNPLNNSIEGLDDKLETEKFEVSINSNGLKRKLFSDNEYKDYKNSFYIEKLLPGDEKSLDLLITLKESENIFDKDNFNCTLFIYQEETDSVDEVDFKLKI